MIRVRRRATQPAGATDTVPPSQEPRREAALRGRAEPITHFYLTALRTLNWKGWCLVAALIVGWHVAWALTRETPQPTPYSQISTRRVK